MSLTQDYAKRFKIKEDRPKEPSSSFKTVGREHRSMFNRKLVPPIHDLQYQIATSMILKHQKKINPESVPSLPRINDSPLQLSEFQLQRTIMGKIAKKQSHHLKFQKQSPRPQNLNKIWYQKGNTLSPLDRENSQSKLKQIHSFKSYSPHGTMRKSKSVDTIYNDQTRSIKKRSDMHVLQMKKVQYRPKLPRKYVTELDYGSVGSLMNRKKPLMKIVQSQRKVSYLRQVISDKMGCYR